eukprot:CAMPEP_0177707586 /NCGR_PEP_ID=MMETSP0484_2-20121128/9832_1 /TAXON_ID=354590 /ORGANISM="Rhodomonas lens, Strain RHODO" /LENGTH=635 /DNA_ID=CAMNT_0019219113 /DNA_START=43 /DNA_END=1950 /DNA_ORIENTATION=-
MAREPAYRFALLVGVLFASAAAALPLDALKTPTGRFSPLRLKGGCGFLGVYGSSLDPQSLRMKVLEMSRLIRHRGPDGSGIHLVPLEKDVPGSRHSALGHERLAIVGAMDDPQERKEAKISGQHDKLHTLSGNQPLFSHDRSLALAVNGEIYNHQELKKMVKDPTPWRTKSDCESIIHLYAEVGDKVAELLDGDFAFAIAGEKGEFYAARDPMGVDSMYMGWGKDGAVWFASEMKCLMKECQRIEQFPPGHYWSHKTKQLTQYYKPKWFDVAHATEKLNFDLIRDTLLKAIDKRLMTDVPYGVLLSGGLDSSLIASCVVKMCDKLGKPRPATFSIGLKGAPDLENARAVADMIGTEHHEFHFTVDEGIDAVQDVIYHLETYDVTTIRAGTPMFLLARKIKAMGVKMVLSGEGADEELGGYLYFHKAPNGAELHEECVRKLRMLYLFDCLRANKATMAWGLEARVPFLDKDFLDVVMSLDPDCKMVHKGKKEQFIEKWVVREAFNRADENGKIYLPKEVLFRQKEQFSDGVGYDWIDGLKSHANKVVDDMMFAFRADRFPHNTPGTKEAYYSRMIFEQYFPSETALHTVPGGPSVACSTAKAVEWDAEWKKAAAAGSMLDQSGRSVDVHDSAKKVF